VPRRNNKIPAIRSDTEVTRRSGVGVKGGSRNAGEIVPSMQCEVENDFSPDSAVEAESTRRFDKLKAPSEVEGLTLAATRSRSLNCGILNERVPTAVSA
jgi:hypothetical protein